MTALLIIIIIILTGLIFLQHSKIRILERIIERQDERIIDLKKNYYDDEAASYYEAGDGICLGYQAGNTRPLIRRTDD